MESGERENRFFRILLSPKYVWGRFAVDPLPNPKRMKRL